MAEQVSTFLSNPDLRFILFGGKGGTGKTTAAAAAALHFAWQRPDQKVLLVSTDPAHSLSDSLACAVGGEIAPVAGVANLFALALDAAALLAEFKRQNGTVMRLIAERGTYFDREDIASLFELSLPGIDETMAIIKIMHLMREGNYDLVILDTAPSGHTTRLLALPGHMEQWLRVMDMMLGKHRFMTKRFRGRYVPDETDHFLQTFGSDAKRIRDLLRDTRATEFVPVVNPEAMSIYETETLIQALDEGNIPVRSVILNRVLGGKQGSSASLGACPFCQARYRNQAPYRQEIAAKFARHNLVTMPLFPREVRGVAALAAFAELLFNSTSAPLHLGPSAPQHHNATAQEVPAGSLPSAGLADLLGLDLRLLLFGGKGGVGKTTLAAATALAMTQREPGKKILVFSTDPARSLPDSLGCAIGDQPTPVPGASGLYAMQINAEARLAELKQRYAEEINEVFDSFLGSSGIDVAFDRDVMLEFISLTPPGLDEVVALISLVDLLEADTYDRYVLDTAPTGHVLRLLEMPELAIDWFKTFLRLLLKYRGVVTLTKTAQLMMGMLRGVRKVREHLLDAQKTEFVAVTIPEAMGLFETERFLAALEQMQIPCRHLVVNMVMPPTECDFCLARRAEQQSYIRALPEKFSQYTISQLTLFPYEIRGLSGLQEVGDVLYRGGYERAGG